MDYNFLYVRAPQMPVSQRNNFRPNKQKPEREGIILRNKAKGLSAKRRFGRKDW